MRPLVLVIAALLSTLAACSGGAPTSSECCKTSEEIKAQMPKCCSNPGTAECCKKKSDCCKKAEELSAKLPDCCKKGDGCCKK